MRDRIESISLEVFLPWRRDTSGDYCSTVSHGDAHFHTTFARPGAGHHATVFPHPKDERDDHMKSIQNNESGQSEHLEFVLSHEAGERMPKKKRVETEDSSAMEGMTYIGNFWPQKIYEDHFSKKLAAKDLTVYENQKGIFLDLAVPAIAGVTLVTQRKSKKVSLKVDLGVPDADMGKVFERASKKVDMTMKRKQSDEHGTTLAVTAKSASHGRKDVDELNENEDPLDFLWVSPFKKQKKVEDDADDTQEGEPKQRTKPQGASSSSGTQKRGAGMAMKTSVAEKKTTGAQVPSWRVGSSRTIDTR